MAMVINTNTASLTTQRHLSSSRNDMEVAMERMSSGSRVNSSMDDAAGLAIGNRMTSQVEGLNQAVRNANDGISLAQTAEGALQSSSNILQRIRVLAVQAANDTYSAMDRKALNNEIVQLKEELNRGVNQAEFNGQKILNGTNASFTFQVGHKSGDDVKVTLGDMRGSKIGTRVWSAKSAVTPPITALAVEAVTTVGTITGAATGSSAVAGNTGSSPQVPASISVVLSSAAAKGDIISMTVGTTTFEHKYTAAASTAALAAKDYVAAFNADATASAAFTANSNPTAVKEVDDYTYSASPTGAGGKYEYVSGGVTYTGAWQTGDPVGGLNAMTRLANAINAANPAVDYTAAAASGTVLTRTAKVGLTGITADGTNGGSIVATSGAAITISGVDTTAGATGVQIATVRFSEKTIVNGEVAPTATAAYTPVPITAEQESYDYSGVTLAEGDRVSLKVSGAAAISAVQEIDTYTLGAPVALNGSASFSYAGATYTQAFVSTDVNTIILLAAKIDAAAGITAAPVSGSNVAFTITNDVGNNTQMITGTIAGTTNNSTLLTITKADSTTGVSAVAAKADKTYIQEFATDQATTLNALGALVVNGESGYTSKAVSDGKLFFTGAADGTVMTNALAKIESATVSAANSVDDILVTDVASAKAALAVVDSALEMMSDFRAVLGASSNRMFVTVDNLMSMSENTSAARSRIVDADFAAESASLAKSQVLQKAGTAMLSQANASTQDILSLLK
jgi:flagellin